MCGSSLSRKNKCACTISNDNLTPNESTSSHESTNLDLPPFPFEKEKYYEQGFIRKKCIAH